MTSFSLAEHYRRTASMNGAERLQAFLTLPPPVQDEAWRSITPGLRLVQSQAGETRNEGRGDEEGNEGATELELPPLVSVGDAPLSPTGVPPCLTSSSDDPEDPPEVEWLLTEYAAGRIKPVDVQLPPLPEVRSPAVPALAAFFALVRGLRLRVDDDRPVPLACGWAAAKIGMPKPTVWRARKALVDAQVLVRPAERALPGRGQRGTELFLEGPTPGGPGRVPPRDGPSDRGDGGADEDDLVRQIIEMFDAVEIVEPVRACPFSQHAGRAWRLAPDREWTCGVCHPPAASASVIWGQQS